MGFTQEKKKPQPKISSLKRSIKRLHISALQKQVSELAGHLEVLKKDPEGVIAPFVLQMDRVVEQNNRLAALVAVLIENNGGHIDLEVDRIEAFKGHKLDITFKLSDDKTMVRFELVKEKVPEEKAELATVEVPVGTLAEEATETVQ